MFPERPQFVVWLLGVVGDAGTVRLLEPYVDDAEVGRDAVAAIRQIVGRQGRETG
jgi:hypothetical protein